MLEDAAYLCEISEYNVMFMNHILGCIYFDVVIVTLFFFLGSVVDNIVFSKDSMRKLSSKRLQASPHHHNRMVLGLLVNLYLHFIENKT